MIDERIKRIDGYKDYFITETGRVFTQRRLGHQKKYKLRELKPKSPGKNKLKYFNICLANDEGYKTFQIHRLVGQYFVPGYFDGAVINHIDGNNRNNHYTNLEWTTQLDNIHKSYINSGLDQTRNYLVWELYDDDNNLIKSFKGGNQMHDYVQEHYPDVSASMLQKWGHHKYMHVKKHEPIAKGLEL